MASQELKLEEDEKIIWIGKRNIRSLWAPFLAGILFLPFYGIGTLFFLYAILKWLRVDYVITDRRVMKIVRHYAFLRHDREEIKREKIRGFYSLERGIPGLKYWNVVVENGSKIIFHGVSDVDDLRKLLSARE